MSGRRSRALVGAVVLAAGAGTRFGGGKLLADLEGRPLLLHVLIALREVAPRRCVVVLGADAAAIEERIDWRGEVRIVNPNPEAGLSGSLRMGVDTCLAALPTLSGILVVLADQPRTSPDVMRVLIAASPEAIANGAWAVVPRYAGGGGANPALLLAPALAHVPDLRGDRGMASVLAAHPGRVHQVDVPGTNPDVDTRADLAALAEVVP
jgi:CTP:molybdopterin cytidylyltransferase MocA